VVLSNIKRLKNILNLIDGIPFGLVFKRKIQKECHEFNPLKMYKSIFINLSLNSIDEICLLKSRWKNSEMLT